eukprot:TRINITY_DN729_c1_g1_i1.p1 TRINITY_DN729_c1_g1~~TRINITY_DN729_c1_g1_i1.p1  ORF type:complete len:554 (-),score=70.27 TRINITY_DN729_c1_g1_i1:74-1735(-)
MQNAGSTSLYSQTVPPYLLQQTFQSILTWRFFGTLFWVILFDAMMYMITLLPFGGWWTHYENPASQIFNIFYHLAFVISIVAHIYILRVSLGSRTVWTNMFSYFSTLPIFLMVFNFVDIPWTDQCIIEGKTDIQVCLSETRAFFSSFGLIAFFVNSSISTMYGDFNISFPSIQQARILRVKSAFSYSCYKALKSVYTIPISLVLYTLFRSAFFDLVHSTYNTFFSTVPFISFHSLFGYILTMSNLMLIIYFQILSSFFSYFSFSVFEVVNTELFTRNNPFHIGNSADLTRSSTPSGFDMLTSGIIATDLPLVRYAAWMHLEHGVRFDPELRAKIFSHHQTWVSVGGVSIRVIENLATKLDSFMFEMELLNSNPITTQQQEQEHQQHPQQLQQPQQPQQQPPHLRNPNSSLYEAAKRIPFIKRYIIWVAKQRLYSDIEVELIATRVLAYLVVAAKTEDLGGTLSLWSQVDLSVNALLLCLQNAQKHVSSLSVPHSNQSSISGNLFSSTKSNVLISALTDALYMISAAYYSQLSRDYKINQEVVPLLQSIVDFNM